MVNIRKYINKLLEDTTYIFSVIIDSNGKTYKFSGSENHIDYFYDNLIDRISNEKLAHVWRKHKDKFMYIYKNTDINSPFGFRIGEEYSEAENMREFFRFLYERSEHTIFYWTSLFFGYITAFKDVGVRKIASMRLQDNDDISDAMIQPLLKFIKDVQEVQVDYVKFDKQHYVNDEEYKVYTYEQFVERVL